MRNEFCAAMIEAFSERPYVFFTGDLGFMALEPLQAALGERFINAGVAEQNMVSVAAGVASLGEQCWTYSIAPFMYGRPFEQIRNDVCLHDFDVKLVGNGGGYGYGVMGSTHHAVEDYGVLLTLPNMRVYVPAFGEDLAPMVNRMSQRHGAAYLRLGRDEKPKGWKLPAYSPWRCILDGERGVLVAAGPNAGGMLEALSGQAAAERPAVWVVSELPFDFASIPGAVLARIRDTGALFVLEEHVPQGGIGQMLGLALLHAGFPLRRFRHFAAGRNLPTRYGSQGWHRTECGIDAQTVLGELAREDVL